MATASYPYVIPEGLVKDFSAKVIQGPNDALLEASHISTKYGARSRTFYLKFFTDTDLYKDFGRRTTLPGRKGDYWPAYVYITDVHWLDKNRCHILAEEVSGGLVAVENYDYRSGKGKITVYKKDYSLNLLWKGGYPPPIEVVVGEKLMVSFEGDIPTSLLKEALRLRGHSLAEYTEGIAVPGLLVAGKGADCRISFLVNNWEPDREPLSDTLTVKAGTKILAVKI